MTIWVGGVDSEGMKLFSEANQVSRVAELSPLTFLETNEVTDLKIGFYGFDFSGLFSGQTLEKQLFNKCRGPIIEVFEVN